MNYIARMIATRSAYGDECFLGVRPLEWILRHYIVNQLLMSIIGNSLTI